MLSVDAKCHYTECRYAECHYAKCHYAECHYAECRGAPTHMNNTQAHNLSQTIFKKSQHYFQVNVKSNQKSTEPHHKLSV